MTVATLYSICFDCIKTRTEDLVSLYGTPFKPFVEELLSFLISSNTTPLNTVILSIISKEFPNEIWTLDPTWTQIALKSTNGSVFGQLRAISTHFPNFIVSLQITDSDLRDQDVELLQGFSNLKRLDLGGSSQFTDRVIANLADIANSGFLPHLEELCLYKLTGITDKCLKHLGRITSLTYIDLSGTSVTKEKGAAEIYLPTLGFTKLTKSGPYYEPKIQKNLYNDTKRLGPQKMHTLLQHLTKDDVHRNVKSTVTLSSFVVVGMPTLVFIRPKKMHRIKHHPAITAKKRKIIVQEEKEGKKEDCSPLTNKKQRPNVSDYFAMFSHEFIQDDE